MYSCKVRGTSFQWEGAVFSETLSSNLIIALFWDPLYLGSVGISFFFSFLFHFFVPFLFPLAIPFCLSALIYTLMDITIPL